MALWQWSKTATSNATADATINWSEGMPPSVVDDSARALMARVAEYRDDISCSLTTGGTASAYTLTTNEGLATPTPTTGQLIGFVVNVTNAQGATLAVDGGSVYPLQTQSGQTINAGVLVASSPYTAMFSGAAWLLRNFFGNPFNTPIGGLMPYLGSSAPNSNFVLPFGQAISRTTYATLFALVGTTFGAGDGSTTFNVPDLRGKAIFGLDNMGGTAANLVTNAGSGITGTTIGATGGNQLMQQHNHGITDSGHSHTIWQKDINDDGFNVTAGGTLTRLSDGAPGTSGSNNGNTQSTTTGITINNTGSGGSQNMPPAMMLPYILRII